MKFFSLAALGVLMTISAGATTVIVDCGSSNGGWSFSAGGGDFTSASPANSGSEVCPAYSALPAGETFDSLQIIVQTDYSGGTPGQANAIETTYSSLAAAFTADILTSQGPNGGSTTYTSNDGASTYAPYGPSYFIENTTMTSYPTTAFDVQYSAVVTEGSVQTESGQVYELITYSTTAPEPGSMMLLGSGLLAFAFFGRKLVRK